VKQEESKYFRQSMPPWGVSLQRATEEVPNDGFFHLLVSGQVVGRHKTLKRGQAAYSAALHELGYTPPERPEQPRANATHEAIERHLDELQEFWAGSHKHRRRGGKTMYR
jgi:hypothetical protein